MTIDTNTIQNLDILVSSQRRKRRALGKYVYRNIAKRALDITLVLLALPVALPLIVLMGLLVVTDGKSPFYTQKRIGRNRRSFRMWKMRTMISNADDFMVQYLQENPEARSEWERTQKLKSDPRITRVGAFMRKTSLDELPQLFNVLIGNMSIVGPRPMMTDQMDLYPGTRYYRLSPGITGLWQISDRNECDFVDRAFFDDAYDKSLSIRTDVKIIAKTFGVVLRGTGC
ncbi:MULTISPECIES: sugar transferase [Rhodobacterales]|uniref:sugar transferase n=1 Tax=Rhodobacterales TaxID=204455 RepID=UPI003298D329